MCLAGRGCGPTKTRVGVSQHNDDDDIPNYSISSRLVITVEILSFLFLLVILAFSVLFFIKRTNPVVFKSGKRPVVFTPV